MVSSTERLSKDRTANDLIVHYIKTSFDSILIFFSCVPYSVGFVRTDQIERTKDIYGINPDKFKIISPKIYVLEDGTLFPFLHSTPIYPEVSNRGNPWMYNHKPFLTALYLFAS